MIGAKINSTNPTILVSNDYSLVLQVALAVGSPLRRQLERRLIARAGRSAVSLGPLLTGAAAGAMLNRRETRRLGTEVRNDLRRRSPQESGWPD